GFDPPAARYVGIAKSKASHRPARQHEGTRKGAQGTTLRLTVDRAGGAPSIIFRLSTQAGLPGGIGECSPRLALATRCAWGFRWGPVAEARLPVALPGVLSEWPDFRNSPPTASKDMPRWRFASPPIRPFMPR